MSIAPPEPIRLLFEARTDRLTRDGLLALDELAVRAAQCPANELAVHIWPAKNVEMALTQRRGAIVQKQLERLGLKLAVEIKPLRDEASGRDRLRDAVLADVGADTDVWCDLREGAQVFAWADEMARFVEGAVPSLPIFWQRLSKQGRTKLAMPLAIAGLCDEAAACTPHLKLYHWLAEHALEGAATKTRRWWLLQLWARVDDPDVEQFRRRWALRALTVQERAGYAHQMVVSELPWPVIERRLFEPEVMAYFGEQPMILGGPGPHWLLHAASRRGQLESFHRLVEAAGPAKACLIDDAIYRATAVPELHAAMSAQFVEWAKSGAIAPFKPDGALPPPCNPTATLLWSAYCDDAEENRARAQSTWRNMLAAGFKPDVPTIRNLMTHGAPEHAPQWKLRRVANKDHEFSCVALDDPTTIPP